MTTDSELEAHSPSASSQSLQRGLKNRHVQLMAIGGAIGVGLFLGSSKAISQAGPGLVVAYAVAGVVVFLIMRALGELLLYKPVAGSFASYAEEFIGPFAGLATGWSYWLVWITAGIAEITAVGIYVNHWFPEVPQWVPALVTLAALYACNMMAVRFFGEMEFWFALIKVVTIVALLVIGPLVILFGWGEIGRTASVSNLWEAGGFFPNGIGGVLIALQMVVFAFAGIELLGVTAGEVENPETSIPKATNAVVWRIIIFYIGALLVLMMLLPWTEFSSRESPFVKAFDGLGIPAAGDIVNFVVITAAASACNSGIFSTGRMLYTLAHFGQAPRVLGRVNRNHVPAAGINASATVLLFGVLLNYVMPEQVFFFASSLTLTLILGIWATIIVCHLRYRRAVAAGTAKQSSFRMPGAPYTSYAVLIFLALVAGSLAFDASTRIALYLTPVWFALLASGYRLSNRGRLSR